MTVLQTEKHDQPCQSYNTLEFVVIVGLVTGYSKYNILCNPHSTSQSHAGLMHTNPLIGNMCIEGCGAYIHPVNAQTCPGQQYQ